jgi:hypothetical protein
LRIDALSLAGHAAGFVAATMGAIFSNARCSGVDQLSTDLIRKSRATFSATRFADSDRVDPPAAASSCVASIELVANQSSSKNSL